MTATAYTNTHTHIPTLSLHVAFLSPLNAHCHPAFSSLRITAPEAFTYLISRTARVISISARAFALNTYSSGSLLLLDARACLFFSRSYNARAYTHGSSMIDAPEVTFSLLCIRAHAIFAFLRGNMGGIMGTRRVVPRRAGK